MDTTVLGVRNRTKKDIEFQYGGQIFKIPAGKVVNMMADAARHGVRKCIANLDPYENTYDRLLAIEGSGVDTDDLDVTKEPTDELLNREAMGDEVKTIELSGKQKNAPVKDTEPVATSEGEGFPEL